MYETLKHGIGVPGLGSQAQRVVKYLAVLVLKKKWVQTLSQPILVSMCDTQQAGSSIFTVLNVAPLERAGCVKRLSAAGTAPNTRGTPPKPSALAATQPILRTRVSTQPRTRMEWRIRYITPTHV